jgi:two-component system response regulator HydG
MTDRRDRVLVVDDNASMAETVADGLAGHGFDAVAVASGATAAERLRAETFDALVTDLRMPGEDGLELLSLSRSLAPERPVIVMTAYSAIDTAVESIRRGAYHYITKPFKSEELALFLGRALDQARLVREASALRKALGERFAAKNIVGATGGMREVCELVERVADADAPVLVVGETGTGKGLVARAIHAEGRRARAPFVTVNCAALPEALLETELFGHVKGAFTGATQSRAGIFVEADGGTLFLDEIGEMSPALQAKLLHVIESGEVRAVGASKDRRVDVRVVAATHQDLRERVSAGAFREDLLYRLDVVTLELPPLRRRKGDLPALIEHFFAAAKARHPRSPVQRLAPDALARLVAHAWPGNVRELEHVLERAVLLGKGEAAGEADLPATVREPDAASAASFRGHVLPLREMTRRYVAWAFDELGGQKTLAAETLGIDVKTLRKWLE